jgi:hypothetical protein
MEASQKVGAPKGITPLPKQLLASANDEDPASTLQLPDVLLHQTHTASELTHLAPVMESDVKQSVKISPLASRSSSEPAAFMDSPLALDAIGETQPKSGNLCHPRELQKRL